MFKPVVQIIKAGESIPFDVAVMRTVQVDLTDPDSVEAAREEVSRQIRAVEADPSHVDTPLATAIDVLGARKGGRSDTAKILEELGRLTEAVSGLPREIAAKVGTNPGNVLSVFGAGYPGAISGSTTISGLPGTAVWTTTSSAPPVIYHVESGNPGPSSPPPPRSDPPTSIKVPPKPPTDPRRPPGATGK